jgi:O-antigen/teichoic acid export membrane protein
VAGPVPPSIDPGEAAGASAGASAAAAPDAAHGAGPSAPRLTASFVTAAFNRGVRLAVPVILIPATLGYLGADFYGLWMAVVALVGMTVFADLGLGAGLMTKLAPCRATGDLDRARRYVSSAYVLLAATAVGLCALLWLVSDAIPWAAIFNATGTTAAVDARAVALTCLTVFLLNVPLSLVSSVRYAYGQVVSSNLWQAAGGAMALPLALAAVHYDLGPVAVVAACVAGPVVVNGVNNLWTYGRGLPGLAPRPGLVDRAVVRELLGLSGMFVMVIIVMTAADNADNLVVAHTLGLADVTAFAVPAKLFTLFGALVSLVNLPLWPAHGEALARGDLAWVRRTVRRMTWASLLAAAAVAAVLVATGDAVLRAWVSSTLDTDPWLLGGFALWWVMLATVSPVFMVQNGAGVVRPQLLGYSLYLVMSVPAKWYCAVRFGPTAIPYAGVAAYALTVLPTAVHGYRRALATGRAEGGAAGPSS